MAGSAAVLYHLSYKDPPIGTQELVDRAAFIDSVGILSADLKGKTFAKLRDSLV